MTAKLSGNSLLSYLRGKPISVSRNKHAGQAPHESLFHCVKLAKVTFVLIVIVPISGKA